MSEQEVLAVKYRPKKLSEVIGQPVVVTAFTNAFKSQTLHHAYILAGHFGSGKTTVARIVAATENCKKGGEDPCGECSNCKAILTGTSSEVNEIDAGSQGGVDNIRDIHKELYQCPIECKTKYIIIDEAHSLTGAAAEASLKMIEEPPKFVRFILCTTEPYAFKETIHSRCVMWKFNKVNWIEMIPLLEKVCSSEKIQYERQALQIAAKSAKGSIRNSLQNLQTIMNYVGNGEITAEAARQALGVIDEKLYFDLINGIIQCNAVLSYKTIEEILKDGKEAKVVIDGIYEYLNNLLIIKACKADLSSFDFSDAETKRYSHQASLIKGDMVLRMMNLMNNVAFGMEYSLNPQVLLNKFIVESILAEKKGKNSK